jgi:myo-inositol 2-dehydrogenase / D-chiro-inositol 1-dehydrogenase
MIGCGDFARLCHGPSQRKCAALHPDLELAACCDIDPIRAQAYAESFGFARHYSEVLTMLDAEDPDGVVLAVPPSMTCRVASLVLERGFPVLLEKPPGTTPAELDRLIAAAERGGAMAQVAFNRRYMPVMLKAREILDTQFPPEPVSRIDYEMVRFNRWDPDFSTTAIHALDAALFLARSPFLAAEVHFQPQRQGDRDGVNILVEADCASGSQVMVNIQPVTGRNAESAKIHTVGQMLAIRIPASPLSDETGALEHWRNNELVASYADGAGDVGERFGIVRETEAFVDAVRSGTGFTPRLEECRQQMALMEAIRLRRVGPIRFVQS